MSSCAIKPDGVLSNRKMEQVLVDLHRADGILQLAGYNFGHDEEVMLYYQAVLERNGVTQAQFDSSLVWYTDHPAYFTRVYPKVMRRLQVIYDEEQIKNADHSTLRQKLYNDSIFLQKEPDASDLAAHKTWEMHRYHTLDLYLAPDTLPFFTTAIIEEMKRLEEEETHEQQED